MSENDNTLADVVLHPEEVLWPPKVDLVGVGMMLLLALVVGFVSSLGVVLVSFFTLGKFSLESGTTPMLLSMITFFALVIADMIYLWGAKTIFPHMYSGTRTVFMHISVFSVILYILVLPIYMMSGGISSAQNIGILVAYTFHLLLNIFWMELIVSSLSWFRYVLLSLYSCIAGFVVSSGFMLVVYKTFGTGSRSSLFVLLWLASVAFVISVVTVFVVRFLYYRYYVASGSDPLWDTFARVQSEEDSLQKEAERTLLKQ